jgi:hypothetical protein
METGHHMVACSMGAIAGKWKSHIEPACLPACLPVCLPACLLSVRVAYLPSIEVGREPISKALFLCLSLV